MFLPFCSWSSFSFDPPNRTFWSTLLCTMSYFSHSRSQLLAFIRDLIHRCEVFPHVHTGIILHVRSLPNGLDPDLAWYKSAPQGVILPVLPHCGSQWQQLLQSCRLDAGDIGSYHYFNNAENKMDANGHSSACVHRSYLSWKRTVYRWH